MLFIRQPWYRVAAIVTAPGVLLALLGPFGNYLNGPFATRLVYWLLCCWIGLGLYGTVVYATQKGRRGPMLWFPRQVPISIRGAGWYESAVSRWIANPASWREDRP